MCKIRDYAITIYAATTASMVCEMPVHSTGDLLVAFVNKDTNTNFTTPVGWTADQTQVSAGAGGGVYTKRATSSSETVTFALAIETCCAVVISVQNVNGSTVADAVSTSAKSGADDSVLPLAGSGITPLHNNCLILHGLSTDSGIGPNALPPWINLFAGDTASNSLCVSYTQQKTAAAITAPNHWGGAADDSRGFIIAIRDDGTGTEFDAYLPVTTTPAIQISPLNGTTGVVDKGAYIAAASIAVTSIAGKTVTGVVVGSTVDSGINPFRGSMLTVGASSTTGLAHTELDLTATVNLTSQQGLVFGTWQNTAPRDYVDTGKATNGGKYLLIGSTSANWRAWVIGGQFTKTELADGRNNYLIEVGSTDTIYGSAGTANMASADYFAFGSSGYYGAASVRWNEMYLIGNFIIAGGASANPMTFDDLIFIVNNGGGILPLIQQSGSSSLMWCPISFGGVDPIFINCNLNTFQFPRKADEVDYVDFHVSNNKIGLEFYGLSGDSLMFTNCVFTSPSSYYWRFNASHSAAATINFTNSTIVNASVTLSSTVTLTSVSFIDCSSFIQNGAVLTDCSFNSTKITSATLAEMDNISNSSFTSSGTGYAIEVSGSASTISLSGLTFSGYASLNGSTGNEAIYVNIASGIVTLNVSGGTTPSIRTSGATVVVNNNVSITLSGLKTGSEVRVYTDNVGQNNAVVDGVESSGTSFTFSVAASTIINIMINHLNYLPADVWGLNSGTSNSTIPISQFIDRQFLNP